MAIALPGSGPPPPSCSPTCPECQACRDAVCVLAAGQACGAATCVAGMATPQGTCTAGGTCQPGTPVSCAPYVLCAGNVCATTCGTNGDCLLAFFCNTAHQCVGTQADGASCANGGQCQSGNCVDGVCCNSACTGECEACNVSSSVGTCSDSSPRTPCTSVECGTCDGDGNCEFDPDNTACCRIGLRCQDGACCPAYATIPECGGRCNCPGSVSGCDPSVATQFGPPACASSDKLRCSDCFAGCVGETNCDDGDFERIPNGPLGTRYYCTCTPPICPPDPEPGDICGTCPMGAREFCNADNVCWFICDDP